MRKEKILIVILSNVLMFLQVTSVAYPQNKFVKTNVQTAHLKKLIMKVNANPNSLKAYQDFINALDINDPMLPSQYSVWMKRFPKSAITPFALGKTYEEYDDPRCEQYLLDAIRIDSCFAQAWRYLSLNATLKGDKAAAVTYMRRATKSDPKAADCAFDYASLQQDGDPAKYDSLMLNVAYRFPDNGRGAEALFHLAALPYNENEKTAYYEGLYQMGVKYQLGVKQSAWFRAGMANYYNYLLSTSPDKAFDLALRMILKVKTNRGDWKQRITVARQFVEARKLLTEHKPLAATVIVKHINLGNSDIDGITIDAEETLILFKAEVAYACNEPRLAYDSLALYYSKKPSQTIRKPLMMYARALQMDSVKVDSNIWKLRDSLAWKPTDFDLENYVNHKQVSLSDYRGKIVLLTYWNPSCFPCREEFPHLEAVLKKINSNDVVYLAINAYNHEEDYVIPFQKNNGYTFVSLRDDPNKSKGNLPQVRAIPANFLFDQKGRVIFSDFQITDKNEDTLELMIKELLKMGNAEKLSLRHSPTSSQ